jgi:hypothetical protein
MSFKFIGGVALSLALLVAATPSVEAQSVRGRRGQLDYSTDELGNRIPDFSNCGYAGADAEIPAVETRVVVTPADGDDGARIQAAIDYVAGLPLNAQGFRGSVRLASGEFQIDGQLRIRASGIVLQGSGATENGTTLIATGTDRRELMRVYGEANRKLLGEPAEIAADIVPVGGNKVTLDSTAGLKVGDTVIVTRRSTVEWIKFIGCDAIGVGWRPGSRDIGWDRVITAIYGNTLTLDAPISTAIEKRWGGGTVQKYSWPGRISRVGVQDVRLISQVDSDNPMDEDHAWLGITLDNVENAWVARVTFQHFAGGAVHLLPGTKWVTVVDCISTEPVSELGGYRRHTFFTQGQLGLFLRCWSEDGRRDFAVGHCAPGPNAFVNCIAMRSHSDSGPLESWASGVLFDNVRIEGGGLHLVNRWTNPAQVGWSAANCVLWQCRASTVHNFRPPGANNWSLGNWAAFSGDGTFEAQSDFVSPLSLYQGQLAERVGEEAAKRIDPILGAPVGATNPTYQEAAEFVAESNEPARQLVDIIRENIDAAAKWLETSETSQQLEVEQLAGHLLSPQKSSESHPLSIVNGWLVIDGQLKTGDYLSPTWWRGTMRPNDAPAMGPNISRFVPGRWGTGLTDELDQFADYMVDENIAAYEHHYGLWYERRRDDHLMGSQEEGSVIPPFYEQPFARTGEGTAWDGLSKYDLTKPNPWYWQRLTDFGKLANERGLVLFHQHFFQHNILEAGAHWVDCPWRPANNVNDMGLPEPPPFIGDKRLFMAHNFYDLSYAPRRELFRQYIRHCLDEFADSPNVIQLTSAEYTGPLEFVQFWLDTIIEWQKETGKDPLVAISATKDVQDAILADPDRSPFVDIIDIRYWMYDKNGKIFAPAGGVNLAPRQHARQIQPKGASFDSVVKSVREMRSAHPEKAVTYFADQNFPSSRDGWAVLIGGGSLPNMKLPAELAKAVVGMKPADGVVSTDETWCLAGDGGYLIYSEAETLPIKLAAGNYTVHWLSSATGQSTETSKTPGGQIELTMKSPVVWLEKSASP